MTETQTILKPQNLRVGNWLLHNNKPFEVIDICAYVDADSEYDGWLISAVRIEELQPIELTPEILEKAGFEKEGITTIMKDDFPVYFKRHNSNLQAWAFYISNPLKLECKYLHQLQNLYHSFTGTELEIDLSH